MSCVDNIANAAHIARAQPFRPCLIIPCYNHGRMIAGVLARLEPYGLHCFIVNDGSNIETKATLDLLAKQYSWVTLIHFEENQGKGAAVIGAMRAAKIQGYSHCLQIDADGQHNFDDITKILTEARNYPDALVSGSPIYDETVPKSRFYARYITHIWVWIETLSFSIKDSMCGFRVYPIAPTLSLADSSCLGQRMDFDTEVMVRLYWQGIDVRFIPTKVIYPEDGLSNFEAVRDNIQISKMHTRLVFAMLPKIPKLIARHFQKPKHWSQTCERKGLWGIRFMVKSYQLFGRAVFNLLLYPVIGYFWLTGTTQRQASTNYLAQLRLFAQQKNISLPKKLSSFYHFMRFGEAMLDKIAGWLGHIRLEDIYFSGETVCQEQLSSGKGTLVLGSHLGDIELCRALGELSVHVTVNALVFTQNAVRFNQVMQEINPNATLNLIQVDQLGADTAILLQQKLDAGEWVAIVGDRTPINQDKRSREERIVWADFLGKPAPFPVGPFVLAKALRCPVFLMFGLKPKGRFEFYFEPFADPIVLPRDNRQQALQETVQKYANRLEYYCLHSPLDWFNFYDFWQLNVKQPFNELNEKDKNQEPV